MNFFSASLSAMVSAPNPFDAFGALIHGKLFVPIEKALNLAPQ
ncbi:MAG TPA: hypothetical protein VHS96_13790 [Bacteroidia bacterium]|nr:hypothetical protein [Bacteroidia bacterium]